MGQLQILKTRADTNVLDEAFRRDLDDVDELDVEKNGLELARQNRLKTRNRLLPWFFRTASPRPWFTSAKSSRDPVRIPPLADSLGSTLSAGKQPGMSIRTSCRQFSLQPEGLSHSVPRRVPVATVNLKAIAESPRIRAHSISMWVTVDAFVDVNPVESFDFECLTPLDMVIILDDVPLMSIGTLRKAVTSCSVVVSSLNTEIDHFAIGYLDAGSEDHLNVLLPLGLNSVRSAMRAMETYQIAHLAGKNDKKPDIHKAIRRAASMLNSRGRATIGHILFITASLGMQFSIPSMGEKLSIHTMSPDCRFHFENEETPRGWHVFSDTECYEKGSAKDIVQGKVRKMVRHIRAGVDSGAITDLTLNLTPREDCQILSIWEDTQLPTLRPGERWVVPVQVSVPATDQRSIEDDRPAVNGSSYPIEKLMNQLYEMLGSFSREVVTQDIMAACLEYKHSALGEHATVRSESYCRMKRNVHRCYPEGAGPGLPIMGNLVLVEEMGGLRAGRFEEDEEEYYEEEEEDEEGYDGGEEDGGDDGDGDDDDYEGGNSEEDEDEEDEEDEEEEEEDCEEEREEEEQPEGHEEDEEGEMYEEDVYFDDGDYRHSEGEQLYRW